MDGQLKPALGQFAPRAWPWAALAVVLASLHMTAVSAELGGHLGGDNAVYFLLSRSIAEGKGYVDLFLAGEPPHTKYPFMFPLFLAPPNLVFDNPLPAMHAMIILANVAAAVILAALAAKVAGKKAAGLVFGLIFGTVPLVYIQSGHLLSEPLYLLFCALTLYLLHDWKDENISAKRTVAMALLAMAAYFTRTAGVALLAAVAFALWSRGSMTRIGKIRIKSWMVVAAVFIALAFAWALRNKIVSGESAVYAGQFFAKDPYRLEMGTIGPMDLAERVLNNLKYHVPLLGMHSFCVTWILPLPNKVANVLGWALGLMAMAGLIREIYRGERAMSCFYIVSLLILLVWPYQEDRFLYPLVALTCFYLYGAIEWAMKRAAGEKIGACALYAVIAIAAAAQVFSVSGLTLDKFADGREPKKPVYVTGFGSWKKPIINWAKYDVSYRDARFAMTSRIKLQTNFLIINAAARNTIPPDAVVMSRIPMITYMYSGRKSVFIPPDHRPEIQWKNIQDNKVDYLITGFNIEALRPMLEKWPERFKPVLQIQGPVIVTMWEVVDNK